MAKPGGQTILVVDDELTVADAIAAMLKRAGYRVEAATHPVRAFNRAQKLRPGLMVIDWKMGNSTYDGLELLYNVRKDAHLGRTPVILLVWGCAWYRHDEFFRAINFPPDDYLDKPFSLQQLLFKVRCLLSSSADPPADPPAGRGDEPTP
jgi:DNA-binding response OmpR family regulator